MASLIASLIASLMASLLASLMTSLMASLMASLMTSLVSDVATDGRRGLFPLLCVPRLIPFCSLCYFPVHAGVGCSYGTLAADYGWSS